jgi:hypothetical protein
MAADVEAVIAALQVALDEAQKSQDMHWKVSAANRWIDQLPGAWSGRWRDLKLVGISDGEADREEFVGHVRAVLAYLDASRDQIRRPRKWWPARRRASLPQAAKATQQAASKVQAAARPINLLKVRKPMPGVH